MSTAKYVTDSEATSLICEYGRRIYARGLVGGNEGNITCRTGADEVWVTPTMESKGYLAPDMLIKVNLKGDILNDATHRPSSELYMHLGVYQQNEAIQAIFHAHPVFATAYSIAAKDVSCLLMPEALFLFGEKIGVAAFAMPGTMEVPSSVIPFVQHNKCCLLSHHGALTWGHSMKEAWFLMEEIENYCHIHLNVTTLLKEAAKIPKEKQEAILEIYRKTLHA